MTVKTTLACLLLLCIPSVGFAQVPKYQKQDGSLVYNEVTISFATVIAPQGDIEMKSTHDATIELSFGPDDNATAVYKELSLSLESPQGIIEPDTDMALDSPFMLVFPKDGRVQTIEVPDFSDEISAVTDLSFQFYDFFLPLPEVPLSPATTWTDSLKHTDDNETSWTRTEFVVVGDTTIGADVATIISYESTSRTESEKPGPGPGITTRAEINGEETGQFFFSVERGVLTGRERQGSRTGTIDFVGTPQPVQMGHQSTYSSTIRLQSDL